MSLLSLSQRASTVAARDQLADRNGPLQASNARIPSDPNSPHQADASVTRARPRRPPSFRAAGARIGLAMNEAAYRCCGLHSPERTIPPRWTGRKGCRSIATGADRDRSASGGAGRYGGCSPAEGPLCMHLSPPAGWTQSAHCRPKLQKVPASEKNPRDAALWRRFDSVPSTLPGAAMRSGPIAIGPPAYGTPNGALNGDPRCFQFCHSLFERPLVPVPAGAASFICSRSRLPLPPASCVVRGPLVDTALRAMGERILPCPLIAAAAPEPTAVRHTCIPDARRPCVRGNPALPAPGLISIASSARYDLSVGKSDTP